MIYTCPHCNKTFNSDTQGLYNDGPHQWCLRYLVDTLHNKQNDSTEETKK